VTPTAPPPPSLRAVSQQDLVRAALVVVAALVGLQLLWSARFLVLTAFLGVLFGLAASGAVDRILRYVRVKRTVVAAGVVFGTVGLLVLVATWMGPTLARQSQELRTKLPVAVTKVEAWLAERQPRLLDLIAPPDSTVPADTTASPASGAPATGRLVGAVARYSAALTNLAFGVVQSTIAVAAGLVLVVFLAVYVSSDPEVYRRGIIALVPVARRERISSLLHALGVTLRTWFATQLIAMLVIGTVTTIALAIIGVRAALPLGVLAGIFEFIPNVGPLLSAIPAILMGFVDSPRMALVVLVTYWAIQFLENNLLIPYLMKEQLDLPPALTLITQVVMAYVFGFLGLFVAIPLLASAVVTVRTLWVEEGPIPGATTGEVMVSVPAAVADATPRAEPHTESPL
jgi:predicted PurR-regulated permease PerM